MIHYIYTIENISTVVLQNVLPVTVEQRSGAQIHENLGIRVVNIPSTFIPTLSRFHSQVGFLFPLPSGFHGIPTFPGNPVPTVVSEG